LIVGSGDANGIVHDNASAVSGNEKSEENKKPRNPPLLSPPLRRIEEDAESESHLTPLPLLIPKELPSNPNLKTGSEPIKNSASLHGPYSKSTPAQDLRSKPQNKTKDPLQPPVCIRPWEKLNPHKPSHLPTYLPFTNQLID
jgi:hypothetical protein